MSENNIIEAVSDAAFGEFNHHIEIYQRTSDIDNYLRLMNPDCLVDMILSASDRLTEIGMEVIERIYRSHYASMSQAQRLNLQPSFKMHKDFKSNLLADCNKVQMDIDHFGVVFCGALEKIEKARRGTGTLGGAAIGGVIGSLFGPVGTLIGSFAGTALVDGTSKDEAVVVAEKMAIEYRRVVECTNSYLEAMAQRTVDFMVNYEDLVKENEQYIY